MPDGNPHDLVELFVSEDDMLEWLGRQDELAASAASLAHARDAVRAMHETDPTATFPKHIHVLAGRGIDRRFTLAVAAALWTGEGNPPREGQVPEDLVRVAARMGARRCQEVINAFSRSFTEDLTELAALPAGAPGASPRWGAMKSAVEAREAADKSTSTRRNSSNSYTRKSEVGLSDISSTAPTPSLLQDPADLAAQLGINLADIAVPMPLQTVAEGCDDDEEEEETEAEEIGRGVAVSYIAWKKAILWDYTMSVAGV